MKSVLISIQPQWCELIASGKKTVEVRKTRPKLETPFKVYIYETLAEKIKLSYCVKGTINRGVGKVIGEFVCNKIEEFRPVSNNCCIYYISENEILRTGLTQGELLDYADGKVMYHWHISNLVIYDEPRELSEFRKPIDCHRGKDRENCIGCWDCEIKRPPQSWCYVEEVGE